MMDVPCVEFFSIVFVRPCGRVGSMSGIHIGVEVGGPEGGTEMDNEGHFMMGRTAFKAHEVTRDWFQGVHGTPDAEM